MKKLLPLLLLAGTALTSVSAQAQTATQASGNSAFEQQIAAMQAQIDQLSAQLSSIQSQQQTQTQKTAEATALAVSADEKATVAVASAEEKSGTSIAWKGAPQIKGEGGWSFKPRGRIQVDAGTTSIPSTLARSDGFGSEIRRARLGVEGKIPGGFGYKFEMDFAGNSAEVTDAILTYGDGGLKVSIGQQNNFQSMEELTSSRFISFTERAAFTDAFGFERRVGVSGQVTSGPILVQAGVFTDNIGSLPGKSWSMDGRIVAMPKVGDTQLHLGASIHKAEKDGTSTVRYRQRPLVHFTGERFINTGSFSADSEFGLGLEAAAINGPFHVAAEAYWQNVDRPGALADPTFFGGFAEAGIFLTGGDTRGYKSGTFNRVKPANPVGEGGIGAIQFNVRYDYLDLVDAGIIGGVQNGLMASLIWTPTDYTRFMLNYGKMEYDQAAYATSGGDTSYSVDSIGLRAQVDF